MNNETATTAKTKKPKNQSPVEQLRVYQSARNLEDKVGKLVEALPKEQYYRLSNDLKRASSACAHFISEAHERYSFALKIESFHEARRQAEDAIGYLIQYEDQKYGKTGELIEEYTGVIKQCWGMIKWLRTKREELNAKAAVRAKDELVAARS